MRYMWQASGSILGQVAIYRDLGVPWFIFTVSRWVPAEASKSATIASLQNHTVSKFMIIFSHYYKLCNLRRWNSVFTELGKQSELCSVTMLAANGGVGLPHEPPLGTNSARAVGGYRVLPGIFTSCACRTLISNTWAGFCDHAYENSKSVPGRVRDDFSNYRLLTENYVLYREVLLLLLLLVLLLLLRLLYIVLGGRRSSSTKKWYKLLPSQ
jgi:hypothetical protein